MRDITSVRREYANRIYNRVEDQYEIITFFSSNHVEVFPNPDNQYPNFTAGEYLRTQVDYEGTGLSTYDATGSYGSSGKLLGVSILDVAGRSLNSYIATHEILHQWAAFIPDSLGLTDGSTGAHYEGTSSAKSLVGGMKWSRNENNGFTVDCGWNALADPPPTASLLNLYMMGSISGLEVDTLWAVSGDEWGSEYCSENIAPSQVQDTVAIEDIQQAVGGPREPGPESARQDFSILFAVESNGRLLTDLEMAFYDLLAQHYTSSTAEGGDMSSVNWSPVQPYFGHGTSWSSEVEAKPPLPVELVSLDGTTAGEKAVRLTWQTASETNNAGFEVQRKVEESAWQQVGYVESKAEGGTTTEAQSYQFTAEDISVGTHQFRLKQVDLDGSSQVHGPISVDVQMQKALKLTTPAPNPVSSTTTFSFAVKEQAEATVTVYDMLGRRVATLYDGTPTPGQQQRVQMDASTLPSGPYLLRLRAAGRTETQRVTVLR
jgi:hypothetical protein